MRCVKRLKSALTGFFVICLLANGCARQDAITTQTEPHHKSAKPQTIKSKPVFSPVVSLDFMAIELGEIGTDRYEINGRYPQLQSPATLQQHKWNAVIKGFVMKDIRRFRQTRSKVKGISGMEFSCEIIFANERIISLKLIERIMEPGQMHPINYPIALNFDLQKGKAFSVNELFGARVELLKTLSDYSAKDIATRYQAPPEMLAEGTEPRADNFTTCNIASTGLLISFDDYQVGPHSMGSPLVLVPWNKLSNLLKPNSPVHFLVGH